MNRRISANTRSWGRAEDFAREYLEGFDPDKIELKRLRAVEAAKRIPIDSAVKSYLDDMRARNLAPGTIMKMKSLLVFTLNDWLNRQVPRPLSISDLDVTALTNFRASWRYNDLTAATRFQMLKGFFSFCVGQGWIKENPTHKMKRPIVQKGTRTAIFTDDEYDLILRAVRSYFPPNLPRCDRDGWRKRILTFVEMLRWSGADLIDVIRYQPEMVDADGVFTYRRTKSQQLAVVPLPERVLALLRDLPLEASSTPGMPFRTKGVTLVGDLRKWAQRLTRLFEIAKIDDVHTEIRTRTPHIKMLRDTFAVWHLRHGANLRTVSRMLGHSNTNMTERYYLPFVKELVAAHVEDARKSLAHIDAKSSGVVVSIAARR